MTEIVHSWALQLPLPLSLLGWQGSGLFRQHQGAAVLCLAKGVLVEIDANVSPEHLFQHRRLSCQLITSQHQPSNVSQVVSWEHRRDFQAQKLLEDLIRTKPAQCFCNWSNSPTLANVRYCVSVGLHLIPLKPKVVKMLSLDWFCSRLRSLSLKREAWLDRSFQGECQKI